MTPSHLIPRSFVVIRRSIPFLVDTAVERHDLFFQQQQRVVSHFFSSIGTQRFAKDWSHADIRSTTSSIHDRIIGNTSPGIRDFSSPQNTPPTVPVVLLQEDNKSKHQTDSELVTSNGNTKLSQIHKQTNNDRYWEHWMYQLQSPPNVITVARLLSTPLLSYWIITQQTVLAVSGCLLAAISDVADGYLARRANMSTTLGTYLDPLADKIFINMVSVSLWMTGTLPTALVGFWLIKDVGLMVATFLYVRQNTAVGKAVTDPLTTPLKVTPTLVSKVNTGLQFVTLSLGIVQPALAAALLADDMDTSLSLVWHALAGPVLPVLCWVTGFTSLVTVASYALGYSAFSVSDNAKNNDITNTKD